MRMLILLSALLLSGCGVAYMANRDRLVASADPEAYGPPPPEDYREVQEEIIERGMFDPEAVRYRNENEPQRAAIPQSSMSTTPMLVWITEVEVNGKNQFGGYVGYQPWQFAWRGKRLVAYTSEPANGDWSWKYLK